MIVNFFLNNPIMAVVAILGLGIVAQWALMYRKPYCFVRIKEKRGATFVDHAIIYPAYKMSVFDENTKRKITWLQIKGKGGFKKNWKIPKAEELTPTIGGMRLVELLWFGDNDFQLCKINQWMYRKVEKTYFSRTPNQKWRKEEGDLFIKQKMNKYNLGILPDDLAMMDFTLESELTKLLNKESLWDKVKPYIAIFLTGILCLAMVQMVSKNLAEQMSEQREQMSTLSDRFLNLIQSKTETSVDPATTKKPDLSQYDQEQQKTGNG